MERKEILILADQYEAGELPLEVLMEMLADDGICPCLLNDDNGHWALVFEGYQEVPTGEEPQDIGSQFFIRKEQWQNNVSGAVLYALRKEYA